VSKLAMDEQKNQNRPQTACNKHYLSMLWQQASIAQWQSKAITTAGCGTFYKIMFWRNSAQLINLNTYTGYKQ